MSKEANDFESSIPEFAQSDKNRVRRVPNRGIYDRDSVYCILDSSLIGHVSFVTDGAPCSIPMLYGRRNDELLFHGSTKSRLMQSLTSGQEICVSVAFVDGLVLAKSLFHHSMNYRSVTAFGCGRVVSDEIKRMDALKIITDKVMPGRWDDAREPNSKEMKATLIAAVKIETASAKVRTGGPVDDAEDSDLSVWAGVVPIIHRAEIPLTGEHDSAKIPAYVRDWCELFNTRNTKQVE